ncbi:MAG: DNA-directed RNA polymerase subunit A'' [Candidatus Heimdallarchaeaceae archaeon]
MANYLTTRQISNKLRKLREEGIPQTIVDELKEELKGKNVTQKQMDLIIKEIVKSYEFAQIDPGSAVGTVAAQSIGEPGTQMSIPGNEKVVVKIGSKTEIIEIGEFIDNLLEKNEGYLIENETETVVYDLPNNSDIYVLGINNKEKIVWQRILQISRHLPNGSLLRIKTKSGRTITATFSHSFVIRKDNEIVPVKGKELQLGDRLPIVLSIPSMTPITELSVSEYLPKEEIWHNPDLTITIPIREEYGGNRYNEHTTSIKQDDSYETIKIEKIEEEDSFYPRIYQNNKALIPEKIPLTDDFAWFIGAYLAEGSNTGTRISISNINYDYLKKVGKFAEWLNISTATTSKNEEFGSSLSIHLNSMLLAKLMKRMCGKGPETKFVPGWTINTKTEFIGHLLRGFFDGNATISTEKGVIIARSKSKELRDGICLLLSRLGIFAKKSNQGNSYILTIPGKYAEIFHSKIGSDIDYKEKSLLQLIEIEKSKQKTDDSVDIIPGLGTIFEDIKEKLDLSPQVISIASNKQAIGRQACAQYIKMFSEIAVKKGINIDNELMTLNQAYNSDVLWDEIISLEKIDSPTPYVYDFGVSELETFMTAEGIITHNTLQTFHYSGVAEMSVLRGLPRLIEIVDARKNPSTPTMRIHLDKIGEKDEQIAKQVARRIELTTVSNVATSIKHSFAEGCIKIKLEPVLLEDKGIEPETIVKKIQKKRRRIKVEIDPNDEYTIIVTPTKELKFNELPKLAEKVKDIPIKGLKNITRVVVLKNKQGEYYLQSEGSNFSELLRIPGVDPTRCYSSDINQIAETLGIEAARNALIQESLAVMKEQGLDVDKRHVMLVADLMTLVGEVQQIGRHGVSGKKSSVFARAAFEVTVKHLLEAAIHGEHEPLEGITENVIIGQTIALGTGIVDLTMSPNYREFAKEEEN